MSRAEQKVVVGDRGRLVLPSGVRKKLGLKAGSQLLLSTDEDGSLRLRPYRSVANQNRGLLVELEPSGDSMVEELLAERRHEAEREGDQ